MRKIKVVPLIMLAMVLMFNLGCEPEEPYPPPNIDHNFGETMDARDNQIYKTIEIGIQTWKAENLNYIPDTGNIWCYDDDSNNCDTYGRLYDWDSAMNDVCPSGWHLPGDDEWATLITCLDPSSDPAAFIQSTIAGGKMKSTATVEAGTGLWYDPTEGATNC